MAAEAYANNTLATVLAGGTTAPAPGTAETWTFGPGAVLPAAVTGVCQFHAEDPALPGEVFLVTNVSGATGTVTRGAEGSAPAAHLPGFSIRAVITSGVMQVATGLAPSGDVTGVTDTAAVVAAVAVTGARVFLGPGTWYCSGAGYTVTGQGAELTGTPGAVIQPATGMTSPMVTLNAEGVSVRRLKFYGGSGTTASNPAADVISVGSSALRWWADDLDVVSCNGWVLTCVTSGARHGTVRGVKGTGNLNGFKIISDTPGTSRPVQVNILDTDMQAVATGEALLLTDVTDVLATDFNAGISGSSSANGVHISGSCQTVKLKGFDVQGGTGTGLLIEDGVHSPNEIDISSSTFGASGIGVQVTGGASRLSFTNVTSKGNSGDGWQFTGTGSAISLLGCTENTNNGAAGTAYGVNVTSTARVALIGMKYISTGVTARRNITVSGNHVLDLYPENLSGVGIAGNAPKGWSTTQPQNAQANPPNPGSTTSASLVMMGLGTAGPCAITPASTGNVQVTFTGGATTLTGIATGAVGARFGTGVAPANGAAVTGTRFSGVGDKQFKSTGVAITEDSFAFADLLTLAPGTSYWFDIALSSSNPADAAEVLNVSFTAVEIS